MAKIKCYVISCSSDVNLDTRKLYISGGTGHAHWLPETVGEAKKRILQCKKINPCNFCDAEIHEVIINRTKETTRQLLR